MIWSKGFCLRSAKHPAGTRSTVTTMIRRATHSLAPVAIFVALALLLPALAQASSADVIRDCAEDGVVDGDYSNAELREAGRRLPADLDEYSDCRAEIRSEIRNGPSAGAASGPGLSGGAGGGDGGGGAAGSSSGVGDDLSGSGSGAAGDGSSSGSAAESARQREMARADTESLLGDRNVDPAAAGAFDDEGTANGLPLPVLLAIIALVLLAMAGALYTLRKRRPALVEGALRRVPRLRRRA